jgi:hypothetical protein
MSSAPPCIAIARPMEGGGLRDDPRPNLNEAEYT